MSFLVFSASRRAESLNACLARLAVEAIEAQGGKVEAAKHYPCVKTKWVEFLGERPDPALDRVQ